MRVVQGWLDGLLAFFAVAALIAVGLFLSRTSGQKTNAGLLLVAGVIVALGISLIVGGSRGCGQGARR
jgi:hypothetical protein